MADERIIAKQLEPYASDVRINSEKSIRDLYAVKSFTFNTSLNGVIDIMNRDKVETVRWSLGMRTVLNTDRL